jgi:selenocysteine lyase/cysteine desulfurase
MSQHDSPVASPSFDPASWRAEIPILDRYIPLNNCSHAPQMTRTAEAAQRYLRDWNRVGMDWEAWMGEVEACRGAFAALIGAEPHEVAITSSVSAATTAIASTLDFSARRNRVVASGAEFPTVGHVWLAHKRYGAHVDWVPTRQDRMLAADYEDYIDDRTAIVSAAHAWYQNGALQPIEEIAQTAHGHGALLFVDAYQSAGNIPIDVKKMGVDFLAAGAQKYLLGIPGIAFLYVRQEVAEGLHPASTGWFGRKNPFAFDEKLLDWAHSGRRFDTGTPPIVNACVARAGLDVINEVGAEVIREWTLGLSRRLVERAHRHGLEIHGPQNPAERTPSSAFSCGALDSHQVEVALLERGVLASARGPVVRLAPHFYNTLDEMDTAVDLLAGVLKGT